MPCPGEFLAQPEPYRRGVLPRGARAVVIEAARLSGWEAVVGPDALLLGIDRFGASAPGKVLAEKFGLTGPQVADKVLRWIGAA
jgi:transketolase